MDNVLKSAEEIMPQCVCTDSPAAACIIFTKVFVECINSWAYTASGMNAMGLGWPP